VLSKETPTPRKKHGGKPPKEWEPPPKQRQRLSQVTLMAEDAIESPAHVIGRARESVEVQSIVHESQESEESPQSVGANRASAASRGALGSQSMRSLGGAKGSVQGRRKDSLGPKLSVQQLVSDVEAGAFT
jgi:hypothetical protein